MVISKVSQLNIEGEYGNLDKMGHQLLSEKYIKGFFKLNLKKYLLLKFTLALIRLNAFYDFRLPKPIKTFKFTNT